jgi:hypothetical protein
MTIKEIKVAYMTNLCRARAEKCPSTRRNYEQQAEHYRDLLNTYSVLTNK